jgi:hypothetical protein
MLASRCLSARIIAALSGVVEDLIGAASLQTGKQP